MIWTELTRLCYAIAMAAHAGQVDKAGKPYIEHIIFVAEKQTNERRTAIALLHDVLEDTPVTADDLANHPLSIPSEIVKSVLVLTHTKESGKTYMEYIQDVKKDEDATAVKIADLTHNMMLNRYGDDYQPTERDLSRLKRYQKAYQYLTNNK